MPSAPDACVRGAGLAEWRAVVFAKDRREGKVKVGFAETVITPPGGRCALAGYGAQFWSTGVHDDLYASAVYLEDEETRAMLLSFDLIGLDVDLIASLKEAIKQSAGVDKRNIMFTCTHTHEGPMLRLFGRSRSAEVTPELDYLDAYVSFLSDRVVAAAQEAASQARECTLTVNRAYVDENMNRRFFLNDEKYLFIPSHKELTPIAYGHTDKELGILCFCPKGSRHPFGMIVNYTMHPLTAGNTSSLISADVPGVVRDLIRESMECLTCYITGAAGDNHPKAPEAGFAETRRVGRVLATEAIKRAWDAMEIEEPVRLKCLTRSITLRYRTREEYDTIGVAAEWAGRIERYLERIPEPGAPVDVEFSLLAMGPILLIGVPGELVAELGSMLKWCSPFRRTYIMYQSTGVYGYIAHPNAYKWGGYEALAGTLSPSSVRPLMRAILDAAEELHG